MFQHNVPVSASRDFFKSDMNDESAPKYFSERVIAGTSS